MPRRTCYYTLLPFLALLLCSSAYTQTPLRIATFNAEILTAPGRRDGRLQKYRWDLARRDQFERVAAVIEAINPDVLNLVEATSKASVDLLVEILHEKGLTDYRGYHVENNDGFTSMDVALISKIKPTPVDGQPIRTMYSKRDDPTWRQAYQVKTKSGGTSNRNASISRNAVFLLEIEGYKLGFLGLHLKSNPSNDDANALRGAQAKIAQRIIHQEIVGRGYLPIVLGDLNDYDPDVPDRDEKRSHTHDRAARPKEFRSTAPRRRASKRRSFNLPPGRPLYVVLGPKRKPSTRPVRRFYHARPYSAARRVDALCPPGVHFPLRRSRNFRSPRGGRRPCLTRKKIVRTCDQMLKIYDQTEAAVAAIRERWNETPRVGIILGTGWAAWPSRSSRPSRSTMPTSPTFQLQQ